MNKIRNSIIELAEKENITSLGYRKIGEKIGVSHPQLVKYHLNKLYESGILIKTPFGIVKSTRPSSQISKLFKIPILGQANCGQALSIAEANEWGTLDISSKLLEKSKTDKLFAVIAIGDSMNQINIAGNNIVEGDYVVFDGSNTLPRNGDVVLSSVEGLANIKCFYSDTDHQLVQLKSVSDKRYPPITLHADDLDMFLVHGVAVMVIKG